MATLYDTGTALHLCMKFKAGQYIKKYEIFIYNSQTCTKLLEINVFMYICINSRLFKEGVGGFEEKHKNAYDVTWITSLNDVMLPRGSSVMQLLTTSNRFFFKVQILGDVGVSFIKLVW